MISPPKILEITFPNNGDTFVIDPVLRREYQTLTLKPMVAHDVEKVEWIIDEKLFESVSSPYTAKWTLTPGTHEFKIRTKWGTHLLESPSVTIHVF